MKTLEQGVGPESQERQGRVLLHFFRHGEQFKDPEKRDQDYELSPAGRGQAMKKAEETKDTRNLRQSMAFGSPRKRAQQTAAFAMTGAGADSITGNESFDELRAKIDKDIKYGSKVAADPRLNFFMDKNTPFGAKAMEAFTNKRYIEFLVNESDALAREVGDENGSTYSRQAGSIADVVLKYAKVSPRWQELVSDATKKYEETLERFLGSHQGVSECFLAKVIEKTEGAAERDRFVEAIKKQGFDFTEGFDVELVSQNGSEPQVRIRYKKEGAEGKGFEFDRTVPLSVVEEISAEQKG